MSVNETTGDVDIQVTADASGLVAELGRAKAAEDALGAAGAAAGAQIAAGAGAAEGAVRKLTAEEKAAAAAAKAAAKETAAAHRAAAKEAEAAAKAAAKAQRIAAREAAQAAQEATREVGRTRAGYVNLGNQLADVAIQMQMGANPMTILIQQGPQVAGALEMMGSAVVPMLQSLAGLVPLVAAAGIAFVSAYGVIDDYTASTKEATRANIAFHAALAPIDEALSAATDRYNILHDAMESDDPKKYLDIAELSAIADAKEAAATADLRAERDALIVQYGKMRNEGSVEAILAQNRLAAIESQIGAVHRNADALASQLVVNYTLEEAIKASGKATEKATKGTKEHTESLDELLTSMAALARIEQARIKPITEGWEKLDAVAQKANTNTLTGIERVNEELRQQQEEITRLAEGPTGAGGDVATTQAKVSAARVAVEAEAAAKIADIRKKEDEQAEKDAEKLRKQQIAAAEQAAQAVAGLADAAATAAGETYDHQADTANKLREQLAAGDEWYTEAQKQEMADRIRASEAAARRAFAIEKAAKLASATVNTAAAVVSALANPPGPPYSIPQSIAAGVAGGIQIAAIAGQQPAFHTGYAPDEMQARVLRSEAVVTPQGVGALGGAEAIRNANAGVNQTSSGPAYVVQVLGHDRQVLKYKKQAVRRGDAYTDAILAARVSPPWRRSR